jgi:hypothetical protein
MNFSEILTFVRQRIKKLPESPFLHTYIYICKNCISLFHKDMAVIVLLLTLFF